jgi:RNA polymerase sigma-70 factor, ECF subfamily
MGSSDPTEPETEGGAAPGTVTALAAALARAWAYADAGAAEDDVGRKLQAAREAWKGIDLPRAAFVEHVAAAVVQRNPADPWAHVARLHLADLYLACACLRRNPVALEALQPLLAAVPALVRPLSPDPGFAGDVRARVSELLLVAAPGRAAKLARYSGEGTLRSWFLVVVQREALALRKAESLYQPTGDDPAWSDLLAGRFEPELELLRARFLPQLEAAMRAAVAGLARRARVVLRLSIVKGVTMQQIAAFYRVNQSTVSRWIARALDDLHEGVRRAFRERCNLKATEAESLIAAVRSQVEVSLAGLLADTADGEEEKETTDGMPRRG